MDVLDCSKYKSIYWKIYFRSNYVNLHFLGKIMNFVSILRKFAFLRFLKSRKISVLDQPVYESILIHVLNISALRKTWTCYLTTTLLGGNVNWLLLFLIDRTLSLCVSLEFLRFSLVSLLWMEWHASIIACFRYGLIQTFVIVLKNCMRIKIQNMHVRHLG